MLLSERLGVNATTVHHSSRVAKALAAAGVAKTPELLRVVGLPRRKFDADSYPDASALYAKGACGRSGCGYCKLGDPTLRSIQSAMIIEAAQNSGGFFNVGVGQGKTLASLLMHDALEARRSVLLVPAQLRDKTLKTDLPELALHFKLPPVFALEDFSGQDGLFVIGYEDLSNKKNTDLLEKLRPDLIIADEAHKLRNPGSARSKRFLRFVRKNPCKFVAMTGSAMSKAITDFAHLIELALGKNSPVPRDYPSLKQWSDCIDFETCEIGALALMCEDHESAREGFQRRFVETPGVICTTVSAAGMPIELRIFKLTLPAEVQGAIDKLKSEWAWDGEEYSQTLEIIRLERELAQGFYYRRVWPNGIPDREYLEKCNAWQRAIRKRLSHTNRTGQDSPALLEAMAEEGLWTPPEWVDWLTVRHREEPGKETIEVSRYLIPLIQNWQISVGSGIIWVDSPIVGEWLQQAGIPYYGEGQDDEVNALAEQCLRSKNAGLEESASASVNIPTIALSMRAHGTGKNLQAWAHNLVIYPPATNDAWEQMIGRTHRPGQLEDVVSFDVLITCEASDKAMLTALEDAKRVEQTTSQPQKLNLATLEQPDDRLKEIAF
jgi:hypothetical protein